ncbi:MAG TPA: universal stress protein [Bdellovibrionales bacterium]|nr:universal stress protein [Bdellovibrionales bacterium]
MAKKRKTSIKKVSPRRTQGKIWVMALDPFADIDFNPLLRFARTTAEKAGAKLHVAYVLAPASLNWTGDFSGPWISKYRPVSQTKLDQILGESDLTGVVVPCKNSGQREAVKALLGYVRKVKAECVLISTHARSGLERLVGGSFAETLILTAKVPVMVTNPTCDIPNTVKKILMPTDLTDKGERFVKAMSDHAKRLGAEVVLYYKQPDPLDPIIQQGVYSLGGGWVSAQSYIESEIAFKTKEIEKMEALFRKYDVKATHVVDSSPGDLIESINKAALDTGADMVSLRTRAGSWTASLLGSVARGLVRHAQIPVMVQR